MVSLRSTQTQDERAKHLHDFNHDPDVQILLFNTKLGSQSLNLHVGGHRIIACEMPVNMSTFLQVVGRISRVGQRFPCTVYLLWVTDSYDQILLHKLCKKFVATFAGEGGVVTDDSDITENAEEVFRDFFGLKYSPYNIAWGDPNFRHKYDWIRKFEKAKAAEQEVREVESEDDEDEFYTPQLSRRQRPSLPSTTGKIGQSRYCNPGEYSVNVMQKKAINGAVTEGMLAVLVRQQQ